MKKYALLAALLAFVQSVPAQYQRRIQVNVSALRTHLSNATDDASDLVTSSPKITPNGGVTLSWINPGKNGFQGIRTGLEYQWLKQTTEGGFVPASDPAYKPTGFTSSSLHYLSVPVEARFGLAGIKGIVPFVTVGVYASALLTYTETNRRVLQFGLVPQDLVVNTEVSGKSFSYDNDVLNYQRPGESGLIQSIYRPFYFGLMGSVGFDYKISKNQFFSFRIPVRYGVTDVERKGNLEFTGGNSNVLNSYFGYSYWEYNSPKGVARILQNEKRSATHPFSYGLELSYGFVITPKSPSGETTN